MKTILELFSESLFQKQTKHWQFSDLPIKQAYSHINFHIFEGYFYVIYELFLEILSLCSGVSGGWAGLGIAHPVFGRKEGAAMQLWCSS